MFGTHDLKRAAQWGIPGAILCLALGIQLYFAQRFGTGYDEAWNLFYAKIHPFLRSFIELRFNAHPPVASLFLRFPLFFGDTIFWARLGSVIPSIAAMGVLYLTFKRLCFTAPLPIVVLWIVAVSHIYVNISVCVRGYALMTLWLMAALYLYIDIVADLKNIAPKKAFLFVLFALLAVWTEYCAVFFIFALFGSFVLLLVFGSISLSEGGKLFVRNWGAGLLLLLGGVGLLFYFKWTLMPLSQGHVTVYYLGAQESLLAYAVRGVSNNLRYFTVFDLQNPSWVIAAAMGMACLSGGLIFYYSKSKPDPARASILAAHMILWVVLFILGVRGLYPFGGAMRHQFVLYLFILLSFSIMADEVLRPISKPGLWFLCGFVIVTTLLLSNERFKGPPIEEFMPYPLFQTEYESFMEKRTDAAPLYLTNYNHFGFFYHTIGWRWELKKSFDSLCFLYEVTKDGETIPIIVDRSQWRWPIPMDGRFEERIAGILRFLNTETMWLFSVTQGKEFKQALERGSLTSAPRNDKSAVRLEEAFVSGDGYGCRVRLN